jgi:hypothetical protein
MAGGMQQEGCNMSNELKPKKLPVAKYRRVEIANLKIWFRELCRN